MHKLSFNTFLSRLHSEDAGLLSNIRVVFPPVHIESYGLSGAYDLEGNDEMHVTLNNGDQWSETWWFDEDSETLPIQAIRPSSRLVKGLPYMEIILDGEELLYQIAWVRQ